MTVDINKLKLDLELSKRHKRVCKADFATDLQYPWVVSDFKRYEPEQTEDSRGNVTIRVWAECQSCGASGIFDVPDSPEFHIRTNND